MDKSSKKNFICCFNFTRFIFNVKTIHILYAILIAFIISLIIEPAIRFIMKKLKLSRKKSSIIIFLIVSLIILGSIIWGSISLISETSNLLQGLNGYIEKAYMIFQNLISNIDFTKIHLPSEINTILQNSTSEVLNGISIWMRNILNGMLNFITAIPSIAIYFTITIMALYLICVDKVYILDQLEHHFQKVDKIK